MEWTDPYEEMERLVGKLPAERQRDLLELARAAKAVEASLGGAGALRGEE